MVRIVEHLDLRARFDNDDLRENLKRAGLRTQSHVVSFLFFRLAAPIICFIAALIYVFVLEDTGYPSTINFLIALAVGFLGYYLPNLFISNRATKRQQSIKQAFPDALDMLLICVQSGMSVEAAFAKVGKEVATQSLELAEEMTSDDGRAVVSFRPPPGVREPRQAHRSAGRQGRDDGARAG